MRLNGLRAGPSLFIQNQRQRNGPVEETDNGQNLSKDPYSGGKVDNEGIDLPGSKKKLETAQDDQPGGVKDPLDDPQIRAEVMELQTIEDKVIAHEQAHKSVGGEFASAASYGYTVGPDGKRYITSGEVGISVPGTGEPETLIRAMERVKAAALAPANPSGQDQSVAASAGAKILSLRSDIARKKAEEAYGSKDGVKDGKSPEIGVGKNKSQDELSRNQVEVSRSQVEGTKIPDNYEPFSLMI